MAEETRAQLKTYVETGDIPTSAQMDSIIDSAPNIVDNNILLDGNNSITAFAGGGQANATPLTVLVNAVATCASAGDSVLAPVIGAGKWFAIVNATANSCNLFPRVGDEINNLGINNPQALASGEIWLFATGGGGWAGGRLT